jgi:hypothetical protein
MSQYSPNWMVITGKFMVLIALSIVYWAAPLAAQGPGPLPRLLPPLESLSQTVLSGGERASRMRAVPAGYVGRSFLSGATISANTNAIADKVAAEDLAGGTLAKKRPRRRLIATAAFALAAGTVAWLSKDAADDSYDKYLYSASRKRQERHLDRAEGLDRVAGAAFLAMEAGLILGAYWTFF